MIDNSKSDFGVWLRVELAKRRRKVKDLAEALGEKYARVQRILNGYAVLPVDFETRVRRVFARWSEQAEGGAK